MKLFLFLLIISILSPKTNLLKFASPFLRQSQSFCFSFSPENIENKDLWKALVCGAELSSSNSDKNLFITVQLIHIIVVSGAHFVVLANLLRFFSKYSYLNFTILFGYLVLTGAQAPGIRGFFQILLNTYLDSHNMRWPNYLNTLSINFFLLCVFPEWINSWSFLLSAMASTALSFKKIPLNTHARVYLFMIPIQWIWGQISIWGYWCNFLMADIIGQILFPLGVTCIFIPFLSSFFDFSINLLRNLLQIVYAEFGLTTGMNINNFQNPDFKLWLYYSLSISLYHYYSIQKERSLCIG